MTDDPVLGISCQCLYYSTSLELVNRLSSNGVRLQFKQFAVIEVVELFVEAPRQVSSQGIVSSVRRLCIRLSRSSYS